MEAARDARVAPTVFVGLRLITTTYVYDDTDPTQPPARRPGTPARVISAIESPAYTAEDVALLLGLGQHESSLCPGCKQLREIAWHSEMDGWFEAESFVCHACTAKKPGDDKAIYTVAVDSRDPGAPALPPFVLGVTTTAE